MLEYWDYTYPQILFLLLFSCSWCKPLCTVFYSCYVHLYRKRPVNSKYSLLSFSLWTCKLFSPVFDRVCAVSDACCFQLSPPGGREAAVLALYAQLQACSSQDEIHRPRSAHARQARQEPGETQTEVRNLNLPNGWLRYHWAFSHYPIFIGSRTLIDSGLQF